MTRRVFFVLMAVGLLAWLFSAYAPARADVTPPTRHSRPVCGIPAPRFAHCDAQVVTNDAGTPFGSSQPASSSYGPTQLHTAYNLPCRPGGSVQSVCSTPASFGGQTIAIVDAYDDPTVENDLGVYDSYFGLPACTRANGCLTVVNQSGGSTLPSTVDGNWALETSLDVQVAHALCQTCKILLVEAGSSSMSDLGTAVNTAAGLGATEISNSYGGSEWSGESTYDSYYNHPGVAVVVSSGDTGNVVEYPAASPYVLSVGGTTLRLGSGNSYGSESAWSGTGSGCSAYETARTWQTQVSTWSQTGCGSHRATADVAADADPNTGAAIYDSTPYNSSTGWWQMGGTSLAAPIIASVYALAGGASTASNPQSIPYTYYKSTNSHDVTAGSNGTCGTIMCAAQAGYDGPTGLGSPNGTGGFGGTSSSPSPSPTATSTPTPIPTPTCAPGKKCTGKR